MSGQTSRTRCGADRNPTLQKTVVSAVARGIPGLLRRKGFEAVDPCRAADKQGRWGTDRDESSRSLRPVVLAVRRGAQSRNGTAARADAGDQPRELKKYYRHTVSLHQGRAMRLRPAEAYGGGMRHDRETRRHFPDRPSTYRSRPMRAPRGAAPPSRRSVARGPGAAFWGP